MAEYPLVRSCFQENVRAIRMIALVTAVMAQFALKIAACCVPVQTLNACITPGEPAQRLKVANRRTDGLIRPRCFPANVGYVKRGCAGRGTLCG
jgi:hypothetical protein